MAKFRFRLDLLTMILGMTQTGKSTLAVKLFEEETAMGIFINPQNRPIKGAKKCFSYEQVLIAIKNSVRKINYVVDKKEEVYKVCNLWFRIAKTIKRTVIVIDEINEWCPNNAGAEAEPILRLWRRGLGLHEGRGNGLFAVGVGQEPSQMHKTLMRQSTNHFIFFVPKFELEYYKKKGIDVEKEYEHLSIESLDGLCHHFILVRYNLPEPRNITRFKPLKV